MLSAGSVSGQPHSNTIGRMYGMHAMRANNVPDKVIEKDKIKIQKYLNYAHDGGATTSAIHCWTPSIRCALPHGLELLAGRPPRTAGLRVL